MRVPKGWRLLPFSSFAAINPKRPIKKGQRVPFVEMAAVSAHHSKVLYLKERDVGSGGARFTNGDTLFARITPCAENGKIAYVDCLPEAVVAAGSTEFIVFGPRPGLSDGSYLYQLARSNLIRVPAISQMIGTTGRQRVPNAVFDEIEIPVPPLSEQRRIAAILSSVDDAIAATQAVIDQTRVVKQAVLNRLLTRGAAHTDFKQTDMGELPETWSVRKLEDVTQFVTSGSRGWAQYYSENGALFIRIGNLDRQNIRMDLGETQKVLPPQDSWEGKRTRLVSGDVLISITADLGIIGYVEDSNLGEAYINQHIALVRPLTKEVLPGFMAYALSGGILQKHIHLMNDAGTKSGLNLQTIRKLPIPIPPIQEQIFIFEILTEIDMDLDRKRKEVLRLQKTKDALMFDLLAGRRTVPEISLSAAE